MEFVAEIAKALAWPLAAVVAAVMFRIPMRAWLKERPSTLKLGPIEAKWSAALADTETALERQALPPDQLSMPKSATLELLTREQPALAVAVASERLEQTLQRALQGGEGNLATATLGELAERAAQSRRLTEDMLAPLRNLATLRNMAVHSPATVSSHQASEFVRLANATASAIEAEFQITRRMVDGVGNINPDDVRDVIERKGAPRAVELALRGDSSVKRRQVAVILAQDGHLDAAVDLALRISNRSEARTVGRKLLEHAARQPEDAEVAKVELRRLWPHLDAWRHRELREVARDLGIEIPSEWDDSLNEGDA